MTNPGLQPIDQMEILLRNRHLLRRKDREWVGKIGRTVRAGGRRRHLSDRQSVVICDIYDRMRDRVSR